MSEPGRGLWERAAQIDTERPSLAGPFGVLGAASWGAWQLRDRPAEAGHPGAHHAERRHPHAEGPGHILHRQAARAGHGPLLLSPFVLAEVDYLLDTRASVHDELKVLSDVAAGTYRLADFSAADVEQAAGLIEHYQDLDIGLAEASIVVLAARYRTTRVPTFDEKHFRAIRPLHADAFVLLPADA